MYNLNITVAPLFVFSRKSGQVSASFKSANEGIDKIVYDYNSSFLVTLNWIG